LSEKSFGSRSATGYGIARFGRGVFLSKLTRNWHELTPPPDIQLRNHDVLIVLGARKDVEEVATFLGYADRATAPSDIAFMSVAVVIGSLLGAVTIHLVASRSA
jgi:putative transport protein